MTEQKNIEASLGWKLILVATLSNLIFKGGMAMVMGNKQLGKVVCSLFAILIITGILIILFWPSEF
jgi:uncharacterized membrane protein (DUF4010 family)